mmetsp:Transcript_127017/g.223607  ORF Transcript_127017/g.223607 Transcript_127017/m.223607 type:complete len:98 (-) Transcript_127017:10-303(-)
MRSIASITSSLQMTLDVRLGSVNHPQELGSRRLKKASFENLLVGQQESLVRLLLNTGIVLHEVGALRSMFMMCMMSNSHFLLMKLMTGWWASLLVAQ